MNNQVLQGDALEVLKTLPSESVDCCVTSPPYFRIERLWSRWPDRPGGEPGGLRKQAGGGLPGSPAGAEEGRDALAEFGRFLCRLLGQLRPQTGAGPYIELSERKEN